MITGGHTSTRIDVLNLHRGEVVETGPAERVFGQPEHPSTRSLLASVPQLHRRWDRTSHAVPEPPGEGG